MKERLALSRRPTRGMTRKPGVLSTFPLDNLVTEVHRLLGPTWTLPPYNNILPPYLRQPSSQLAKDDLDFLVLKGAFDIPETAFAREIFKAYIRHIHPHIPFLDLDLFADAIFEDSCDRRREEISLLLFQAVMFAGAIFVDCSTVAPKLTAELAEKAKAKGVTYLSCQGLVTLLLKLSSKFNILHLLV